MEGMWKQRGGLSLLVLILMVTIIMNCALGALYRVGDRAGWDPSVNYTEWSSRQHIYAGDWIIFYFNKQLYNVLEVNKTSYETCNDQGFIQNITRGGRDVFQLTEARPYYFLSGRGYCWGGMKLALYVEEIPPTPAPALYKNGSPSNTGNKMILLIALSITFSWAALFILYN